MIKLGVLGARGNIILSAKEYVLYKEDKPGHRLALREIAANYAKANKVRESHIYADFGHQLLEIVAKDWSAKA